MFERRSLRLPITLAVVMIVMLIVLAIGWVLLTVTGAFWGLLSFGAVILVIMIIGVVTYLVLTIKAINLSQRQSNFIDSVTHELKSPIASLKLYLQTMHRRPLGQQEQKDFVRYMLEDVERLDSLINHLLDAARIDKVATPGENEDVAVAQVIQTCADEVRSRYNLTDEQLKLSLQPLIVRGRPLDLEVIFRNLFDNAAKYGGQPPKVEVTIVRLDDQRGLVRVTDNGRGIPVHQRWRVFARFVRLGSELERNKPGTGLGLYLVRTLVDRLKGRVRIRDREGGTGTTFEVTLPGRWQTDGASAAAASPTEAGN